MGVYEQNQPRRLGCSPRLIIGIIIAIASLVSYFTMRSQNPTTGQMQHVSISPAQEIAMGLQAKPEMEAQFGGESHNRAVQERVEMMGAKLVASGVAAKSPYHFEFHLLGDRVTINAFALPGGQVFITEALYDKLTTDGQLAGVLGHEVGHVIERHSAEQIAKQQLTQGLTGAAVIASYDPNNPSSRASGEVAMMIGQLVSLRFSRGDELEADGWGVKLTAAAGYDPRAMLGVMEVLAKASKGGAPPEFFSTHPNPEHREERIQAAIDSQFPNGLPAGLEP